MPAAETFSAWLPVLWYLTIVLLLAIVLASGAASRIFNRLTKVGGFGVEFEFTEPSARKTRDSLEHELSVVRMTIRRELEAKVRATSLQAQLRTLIKTANIGEGQVRATIHIPDPLYEHWLYQLLDYYPRGGGRGRPFSSRAGLIGLVWRSEKPWRHERRQNGVEFGELVEKWGMTPQEAENRRVETAQSLLALKLMDPGQAAPIGVLYLDSEVANRFGETDEEVGVSVNKLDSTFRNLKIDDKLSELVESARLRSPQLVLEKS